MRLRPRYSLILAGLVALAVATVSGVSFLQVRALFDAAHEASADMMLAALESQLSSSALHAAEALASTLAKPLYSFELDTIRSLIAPVGAQAEVMSVLVFDTKGALVHDGTETLEGYGIVLNDPRYNNVLTTGTPEQWFGEGSLTVVVPIHIGSRSLGGVALTRSTEAMTREIARLESNLHQVAAASDRQHLIVTSITFLCLIAGSVVLSLAIAGNLARPIAQLSAATARIGRGDYAAPMPTDRRDELGDLARALRVMAGALETAHAALERAKDEADQASRAKSLFLANMSHEIRTPMNGVMGIAELLANTSLDGRQGDYVRTLRGSAQTLLGILNDVLEISKIEAGQLRIERIEFDLHATIDGVIDLFAGIAGNKGLELVCLIGDDVPARLYGDPSRISQILMNLLGNAVKFTKAGAVLLRVEADAGAGVRFSVKDTGAGIAAAKQKEIFQAFQQADDTITRRFGGTGLGLTISKELVGLMGGAIGVDSAPGQGATFWFTVPLEAVGPAANPAAVGPAGLDLKGAPVLVVVDDPTSRLVLEEMILSRRGRPTGAPDGAAALGLVEGAAERFAFALVDMKLPGTSGLDLARRLAEAPAASALPILVLDSFDRALDPAQCAGTRIRGILRKPVRQADLYRRIGAILGADDPAQDGILEVAGGAASGAAPDSERLGVHVLLAEDNPVNEMIACEYLKQFDCGVEVARSGVEAVNAWQGGRFDLILMDCQMPEMDGLEATRRIRAAEAGDGERGRVPIVALTANAFSEDRDQCLAAGMDGYLAKPFTPHQLAEAIKRNLPPAPPAKARAAGG